MGKTNTELKMPLNLQYFAEQGDPKPDDKGEKKPNAGNTEPTVEELIAANASLKADIAKYKAATDKLCQSEGLLKKQLREKQTAEEAEAQAKADQEQAKEEHMKELESKLAVIESSESYVGMGMDKDFARITAEAEVKGDKETVRKNLAKFMADSRTRMEADIKSELLKQIPAPSTGNGDGSVDYNAMFTKAINDGDMRGAIMAQLQSASANKAQ